VTELRSADGFAGMLEVLLAEAAAGANSAAQEQSLASRVTVLLDAVSSAAPPWPEGAPFQWLAVVDDEQVTVLQPSGPRIQASRRGGRYTALRLMPETGPERQFLFLEAALDPGALAEAGFDARPAGEEPPPELSITVVDGARLLSAHRVLSGGEVVDEQDSRPRIDRRFRMAGDIVRRHDAGIDAGPAGAAEPGRGAAGGPDWGKAVARAGAAVAGALAAGAAAPAPAPPSGPGWALVRVGDPPDRRLPVEGTVRVGRSPGCDLRLDDLHVSRQHATFEVVGGECVVRDLGSSHGTRVNGTRIDAPTRLHDGDRVTIGTVDVSVVRTGPADVATVAIPRASVAGPAAGTACPRCGRPVSPEWKFCSGCGAPIAG
jgi:hypothetical protein